MTAQGCDYAWERPDPKALYDNGYRFAIRYLSYDTTGKNLTMPEAQALLAAGLSIVLNWEYAPRAATNGYGQGQADALAAHKQLLLIGCPSNSVVYFSVDFALLPTDMAVVSEYFRGCASVLGADRVGVYGGYDTVAFLAPSPYVLWFWQTAAWSNGRWHSVAHIRQTANGVPFNGLSIDNDTAMTDHFGQWPAGGGTMAGDYGVYGTPPAIGDRTPDVLLADLWGQEMNEQGPYSGGAASKRQQTLDAILAQAQANGTTLSSIMTRLDAIEQKAGQAAPAAGTVHVAGDLTVTE